MLTCLLFEQWPLGDLVLVAPFTFLSVFLEAGAKSRELFVIHFLRIK